MGYHWKPACLYTGVAVSYDLSTALGLDVKFGRVAVTGFVYYRDAFIDGMQDRVYGGVTLSYAY